MSSTAPFWSKPRIWLAATLGIVLFGLQFVRPALPNPPVTADLQAPPAVKDILKKSCYNCHSNETYLWWYDLPVPVYWLVVSDVQDGRKRLNFSEIGKLSPGEQKAALYECISQIQLGEMPLSPYVMVHPESAITPVQLAVLKDYLPPMAAVLNPPATSPADVGAADAEYEQWISTGKAAASVQPAPNGIAFLPDYK